MYRELPDTLADEMVGQAAAARRARRGYQFEPESPGRLAWARAIPRWLRMVLAGLVVAIVVGGGGWWLYQAFDPLYPQDLWRYFRPAPAAPAGTVLYRDLEGQLFVAPLGDLKAARRLLDANAAAGGREFVRDAVFLMDKERIAYFATVRRDTGGEQDRVKVIGRDGRQVADINVSEAAGEPIRPTVYASVSGRYLAVTSRERTRVFYYDLNTDGPLVPGEAETPPERMLWTRNADLRTPPLPNQQAFAASGDGKLRAQVRAGRRRAPECEEQRCETTQELTVAGPQPGGAVLYGVFSAFSSEGWGPVPAQPAQRLYGRLVWSPDGKQLLFTTLDGESTNTFAIGTDGRSQPRLVLANAEALDWLAS